MWITIKITSLPQARLPHHPWHFATASSESVDRQERRDPYSSETREEFLTKPTKIPKPNQNVVHDLERWDPCHPTCRNGCKSSEKILWMTEFLNTETTRQFFSWIIFRAYACEKCGFGQTQCLFSLPKDRNCEICQRTKITRAPCRRRIGGVVTRAENFGYLITADHKVLSEGCESRNNHRYAVVAQDLATQWILSYPCKTKTSQETERSLRKFLEPSEKLSSMRCRGTRLGYSMDTILPM